MTQPVIRHALLTVDLRTAYLQLIEEWAGLKLSAHQSQGLDEAITKGMLQAGETDPQSWYRTLISGTDRALLEQLAARLTIGETHFFRVAPQIEVLRTTILPDLINRRAALRQLHMWSAGCSTGEEAYTLAMLVREQLPLSRPWTIRLLGTDLNQPALEAARAGLYGEWSFRETPQHIRQQYFVQESKHWRVLPSIRNMVEFRPLNLVAGSFPSLQPSTALFDLIVCRNVTIYFSAQTTQRLYARFAAALAPGGWLLLGPSDAPPETALLEPVSLTGAIVWRRVGPQPLVAKEPALQEPASQVTCLPVGTGRQSRSEFPTVRIVPYNLPHAVQQPTTPTGGRIPAGRQAEQGVAARPLEIETHLLLGLRYLDDGAIDLAIESLRRATFLDEHNILAHFGLGRAYARSGNEVRARASLTHARRVLAGVAAEKLPAGNGMVAVSDIRHAIEMQLTNLDAKGAAR